MTASPPRPALVLRVGIVGHRPGRLERPDEVGPQVQRLLHAAASAVVESSRSTARYYAEGIPLIRLISPLAEGTDRIAVSAAIELERQLAGVARLEVVALLPFPQTEYVEDFETPSSVAEFERLLSSANGTLEMDGTHADDLADSSYYALAQMLVRNIDLLVAVWDGEPPHGRGGTGQVVLAAQELGIPFVWVHAKRPSEVRVGTASTPLAEGLIEPTLSDSVHAILAPPVLATERETPVTRYFDEGQPGLAPMNGLWTMFRDLFTPRLRLPSLRVARFERAIEPPTRVLTVDALRVADERARVAVQPHWVWADGLASYYANQFRSGFLLIYSLSAFATIVSVVGAEVWGETARRVVAAGVALILLLIMGLFAWGRRRDWHLRSIEYRVLAELLRELRYLSLLGIPPPRFQRGAEGSAPGSDSWITWLTMAVAREAGLPSATFSPAYLAGVRQLYEQEWIDGQLAYHRRVASTNARLEVVVHYVQQAVFALSFLGALSLAILGEIWMAPLAAILPALAGAIAASLGHAELERVRRRSAAMIERLTALRGGLDAAPGPGQLPSQPLIDAAESVASAMLQDVLDWRLIFELRPLRLPG